MGKSTTISNPLIEQLVGLLWLNQTKKVLQQTTERAFNWVHVRHIFISETNKIGKIITALVFQAIF